MKINRRYNEKPQINLGFKKKLFLPSTNIFLLILHQFFQKLH